MRHIFFIILCIFALNTSWAVNEITPYKFTEDEMANGMPDYDIPPSSRFTTKRPEMNAPEIVYYVSKPHTDNYAIAILCGGSSSQENISSIIHFHRYFLQELMELGLGVITLEQWGVNGKEIHTQEFMKHYTWSQRLSDHQAVIEHLKLNPPEGWNGKLVFLGVSEGGSIVTSLTTAYRDLTLATINWSGAGDWSWREELWAFLQGLCPSLNCFDEITSREDYDARLDAIKLNPSSEHYFFGMTYQYHADALLYPHPEYNKINSPFLVVAGTLDTLLNSSDDFVRKAIDMGANMTYMRVEEMDHYVRKRPDIIQQSFAWLHQQLS